MMKRIRAVILGVLFLFAEPRAFAQMLDDLFEDEDFESSEIEKMQRETAAKNKAAPKKNDASTVSAAVSPAPSSASVSAQPVVSAGQAKPKTFSLSSKPQTIEAAPALPKIGNGQTGAMPKIGLNTKKKEDENLSLFEMRAKKKGTSNTNVLNFDIAGIRLKMTPQEAVERAGTAGFSVKHEDKKIPVTKEWKYHRQCLRQMFFTYGSKRNCIRETAKTDNSEYIAKLLLENKERRETISVEFTSHLTQNQAYRILYVSKGDASLGNTNEAQYLKSKRHQDFLELLIKKYGSPDDEQQLIWGIAGFNAVLQAKISNASLDFSLLMEDPSIEEGDLDKIYADDMKTGFSDKFSF